MAGARMLTFHPLSIVMHGLGLNITIQTYAGNVDFGIIAGKNALPHAQDLANALLAAFKEAQNLYAMGRTPSAVVNAAPVKTPVPRATKKQTIASKTIAGKTMAVKAGTLKARSTPARRKTAAAPSGKPSTVKKSNASIHGKTKASQRST
jgi:hypothetical protein